MRNKNIFLMVIFVHFMANTTIANSVTHKDIYDYNQDPVIMKETLEFNENYSHWKKEEKWDLIITSGESLYMQLNEKAYTEKALLCARLSSSYFYKGEYKYALEKAYKGVENADFSKNNGLLGRNLYLISAVHRVLSQQSSLSVEEREKHSNEAQKYIDRALAISKEEAIDSFTKAKIAFNAASLAHDVKKDYPTALFYYQEATKIFASNKEWKNDYDRTKLREIRLLMEIKKPLKEVLFEASALNDTINEQSKTKVHALQLLGKIYFALEDHDNSLNYIEKALTLACKKNMKGDVKRLESLKEEINGKGKIAQSWKEKTGNQKAQATHIR